jgi:hypothetical protein
MGLLVVVTEGGGEERRGEERRGEESRGGRQMCVCWGSETYKVSRIMRLRSSISVAFVSLVAAGCG